MTIYQLFAYGQSGVTGERRMVVSKMAHKTEDGAIAHKPEFIKRLTTPKSKNDLGYMDKDNLKVYVEHITLAD